jgi:multiple sugar transport system substrate-binding protein
MAIGGHYVNLTDWIKKNGVDKSMTPASMEAYAEFPKGSGTYWGVPAEGDALGWAYRKDLFEDPEHKAAFRAQYGYELDIPKDYDMMRDIAEYFHDPDNGFYGIGIYGDNGYDSLVMFAEQMMWAYGGDIGDQSTYAVEGIVNSPGSVKGLEMYKELFEFTPPGFGDAFFVKANDAFTAGIVPMTCNFFAFFPGLANAATNPYADVTGYFPCPPQEGVDGEINHYAALGGQGASVVTYSKKQDLAMKWLEWFIRPEVQMKWAMMGGYSCHIETLESDEFLNATPYNPAFKESMEIFKDFWAVPEYNELFESMAKTLGAYVIRGEGSAKQALDKLAGEWEDIFRRGGYYD